MIVKGSEGARVVVRERVVIYTRWCACNQKCRESQSIRQEQVPSTVPPKRRFPTLPDVQRPQNQEDIAFHIKQTSDSPTPRYFSLPPSFVPLDRSYIFTSRII